MKLYDIKPVPKPRMSRADAWKKRDCVVRYWNFKAHCKLLDLTIPETPVHIFFILEMPESWSKKKREELRGQPHKQKPDIDNLLKAVFDAVLENDEHIYDVRASKFWGDKAQIIIMPMSPSELPVTPSGFQPSAR
jgi:Holliday junction resolvase RusA-like endonuclease